MAETLADFSAQMLGDPYPAYSWLRDNHPVYYDKRYRGWILSKYQDVYDALRNHKVFSNKALAGRAGQGFPLISDDQPRHTRLRSLVNRSFTPTVIRKLTPFVEEACAEFIEQFPVGPVEVVHALTIPFPVVVIARVMGIEEKDRGRFKLWSDALTGLLGGDVREEQAGAIMEMYPYFAREIEKRRSQPMDDLISSVADAEVEGEKLSDQEIIGFCLLLLVAGNETTTNLLGNCLNVLVDQPALWERLRAERDLTETAIEEALRHDSPVQFIYRKLVEDVELHGVKMKADDRVIVGFASANRDPENFEDPDVFSLDRDLKQHLAFGHGIHFCLGAPLARLEGDVALRQLLDRFPSLSRAGMGERLPHQLLRGFHKLPLNFPR